MTTHDDGNNLADAMTLASVKRISADQSQRLASLEAQLVELNERVDELELAVFVSNDIDDVDPLEAAFQEFAGLVRARREGNG